MFLQTMSPSQETNYPNGSNIDQQYYESRLHVHRNEMETNKKKLLLQFESCAMKDESPAIWLLHLAMNKKLILGKISVIDVTTIK